MIKTAYKYLALSGVSMLIGVFIGSFSFENHRSSNADAEVGKAVVLQSEYDALIHSSPGVDHFAENTVSGRSRPVNLDDELRDKSITSSTTLLSQASSINFSRLTESQKKQLVELLADPASAKAAMDNIIEAFRLSQSTTGFDEIIRLLKNPSIHAGINLPEYADGLLGSADGMDRVLGYQMLSLTDKADPANAVEKALNASYSEQSPEVASAILDYLSSAPATNGVPRSAGGGSLLRTLFRPRHRRLERRR